MRDGDVEVAVKTDTVLNIRTGEVVQQKTFVAAVPTADGNIAVLAGKKTAVAAPEVASSIIDITLIFL